MMFDKTSPYRLIALEKIHPDPGQPRKLFDNDALLGLAASISQVGVLSPITVQKDDDGYRIIAGERRWRAARIAGLNEMPCIISEFSPENAQLAALIENLQRKDLDPFEEAAGIRKLLNATGMTQEQAALRLGKSQSGIANKLRLLALAPEIIETLREYQLSERHARALLALPEPERAGALEHIAQGNLTVDATERYIENLQNKKARPCRRAYFKDIRIFINTIDKSIRTLSSQGIRAKASKTEDSDCVYYSITIPKKKAT